MNKNILHRFFEGKTTFEEEIRIKEWVDSSDDNLTYLLEERKIYDRLLLNHDLNEKQNKSRFHINNRIIGIAASFLLIVLISVLYTLTYEKSQSKNSAFNTIQVPKGQRLALTLSDSTKVWINANTNFRYPTHFNQDARNVYLDGEAYFEVTKNQDAPFTVNTKIGKIRVTGTKFNVNAYTEEKNLTTALYEGGVDILNNNKVLASLKPNHKSVLVNNILTISKISNTDDYLWVRGLIVFNKSSFQTILKDFEKYYNVKIVSSIKTPSEQTFTGKFRQTDGVDYALNVLQKSISFRYKKTNLGQTILIYSH